MRCRFDEAVARTPPQQDAAVQDIRYVIQGRTRMTVSPNRPQDGNRRPKVRSTGAQSGTIGSSTELPPVLFQLPNLKPPQEHQAKSSPVEPEGSDTTGKQVRYDAALEETASCVAPSHLAEVGPEKRDSEPASTKQRQGRSILSRLASVVMIFGVLALGATWIYVVAKNVRVTGSSDSTVAEAGESADMLPAKSSSFEDTMANVEQLALNSDTQPSTYGVTDNEVPASRTRVSDPAVETSIEAEAHPAKVSSDRKFSDTLVQLDADSVTQSQQAVEALEKEVTSGTQSDAVATLKPPLDSQSLSSVSAKTIANTPDSFVVSMPKAVIADQTPARSASTRAGESVAATKQVTQQADPSGPTPELPSDTSKSIAATATTATPNELTPPLPPATPSNEETSSPVSNGPSAQRQFSRTPAGVSDWLKFLPPAPKQ